jgi:hypothetical protein
MRVLPIKYEETKDWLLNVHYLKRMPPMNYSFGLFDDYGDCLGIVTYGVPASGALCEGICGKQWERNVFELNRMVFRESIKNGCSRLVSGSIKQLPRPMIIVSYADTGYGHVGKVYQACNFIYTGLSAKRRDWIMPEGRHCREATRTEETVERSRKHRYVFINASKSDRKKILRDLNYPIEAYPDGTPDRYEINHKPITQGTLL